MAELACTFRSVPKEKNKRKKKTKKKNRENLELPLVNVPAPFKVSKKLLTHTNLIKNNSKQLQTER